jgi:hypothetical protein
MQSRLRPFLADPKPGDFMRSPTGNQFAILLDSWRERYSLVGDRGRILTFFFPGGTEGYFGEVAPAARRATRRASRAGGARGTLRVHAPRRVRPSAVVDRQIDATDTEPDGVAHSGRMVGTVAPRICRP